ncbi:MAG: hypothetical protein AB1476_01080 [Candidatus Hadarchaeota archaeon]
MVVGLALAWHIGLAALERTRAKDGSRVPVGRLLLMAEVDVVKALVSETKRRLVKRREKHLEQKLEKAEGRLKDIEKGWADA